MAPLTVQVVTCRGPLLACKHAGLLACLSWAMLHSQGTVHVLELCSACSVSLQRQCPLKNSLREPFSRLHSGLKARFEPV
jgi:hypothetical protein